jgi:hypothetical protein
LQGGRGLFEVLAKLRAVAGDKPLVSLLRYKPSQPVSEKEREGQRAKAANHPKPGIYAFASSVGKLIGSLRLPNANPQDLVFPNNQITVL